MPTVIEIKNLGKKYDIRHQRGGYIALRDVLATVFKNPFGFLKHKTRQIAGFEKKESFWALKNINLKIEKGEVLGIIGHNGAGKSTLLKILSQITPPTEGEIRINGRVGSLLEVGTGFHPELTGRENIFLNGAILGMPRKDIIQKFNDIIEFAGIQKFLDTPVKYYSSGMYVRLAFSVAAHMDPDILVVDEVLAVGDLEFQKKCLGKMDEITKAEGRTILFVSHNMAAIEKLCNKVVVLKNGKIEFAGNTKEGLDFYLQSASSRHQTLKDNKDVLRSGPHRFSRFEDVELFNKDGLPVSNFKMGEKIKVRFNFTLRSAVEDLEVGFSVQNLKGTTLSTALAEWDGFPVKLDKGQYSAECEIESFSSFPGAYGVTPWIKRKGEGVDEQIHLAIIFNVDWNDINGRNCNLEIYPDMGIYLKNSWKMLN